MDQQQFWGPYGSPLTSPPQVQTQAMSGLYQGPAFLQMPLANMPPSQFQVRFPPGINPTGPGPMASQPPGFQQLGLFGVPIPPPSNPAMFTSQNFLPMQHLNINAPTFSPNVDGMNAFSKTANAEKLATVQTPVALMTSKPGLNPTVSSTTPTNLGPSSASTSTSVSMLELGVPTSVIFIEGSPTSMQLQLKNESLIETIQSELRTATSDQNFTDKFAMRSEPKVSFILVLKQSC